MSYASCSEMPTKLNPETSFNLVVRPDKLAVAVEDGTSCDGSIQANRPVPEDNGESGYYYFEMKVKYSESESKAAIGYTVEGSHLMGLPGILADSVGYHGDNGKFYFGGIDVWSPDAPTFTIYDVVGAGIDYASNEFFFTKNGELVGTLSKTIDGRLYPTVGVYGWPDVIKVNFGHKPFSYDIEARYPNPCCHRPKSDGSKLSVAKDERWKKAMRKSMSLLGKSVAEKEKEVASLKDLMKVLNDNFQKYV